METIHTIGRRKTSVARVYLSSGKDIFTVNSKDFKEYFPTTSLQYKILQPFKLTDNLGKYNISVNVYGGDVVIGTGTGAVTAANTGTINFVEKCDFANSVAVGGDYTDRISGTWRMQLINSELFPDPR